MISSNYYDSDDDIMLFDSDSDSDDFIQGSWEKPIIESESQNVPTAVKENVEEAKCLDEEEEEAKCLDREEEIKRLEGEEKANCLNGNEEANCLRGEAEAKFPKVNEKKELDSSQDGFIERMKLNDLKAGMEGLDKEKINKIIHEASKGSKYYENEKRKEERVRERVKEMKREMSRFKLADKQRALRESDKILENLRKGYDFSRTLVHIDMDAFYAAVEMRDDPSLKNVPMAVGGNSMLSTSNYLARKFGVRAAMPGFIGKKLCPELVIVPEHFDKYKTVSTEVREIFCEYDPNFSPMSLDEAYLDLTEYLTTRKESVRPEDNRNQAEIVVEEIRNRIHTKTKLTASAGIACNLMLSKICSDLNKPNGQYYLKPDKETVENFVNNLPIRKVFGIGRVTEQMLHALDIIYCRDIVLKRDLLYLLFSDTSFQYFMRVALGISHNRIVHDDRKSMSVERTFNNENNKEKLLEICRSLCEELACDLKKEHLKVRNVTLKYKLSSFVARTRSKTLPYSIATADELYLFAKELLVIELQTFKRAGDLFELRLMGVRGSHFYDRTKSKHKQNTVEDFFQSGDNFPQTIGVQNPKTDKSENSKPGFSGSNDEKMTCPVCGIEQRSSDLQVVNAHIDSCLTKQTIKDIIKEQNDIETTTQESRKRKQNEQLSKKVIKKKKTLISFWKK